MEDPAQASPAGVELTAGNASVRRLGAAIALVAAGAGVAACGGGSAGDTLPRALLAARANAICASAQTASSAIAAPPSYRNPRVAAAYFDRVAPITERETRDLEALVPASDVAADWREFLARQRAATELLNTLRRKAHAADPSGLADLAKVPATGQAVAAAANRLSARDCAG